MSEIKQIQIAGEAASALMHSGVKKRNTRKKTSLTVNETRVPEHRDMTNVRAINLQASYETPDIKDETPTTLYIDNSQQHSENGTYSSNISIGGRQLHLENATYSNSIHGVGRQQHQQVQQHQQKKYQNEDQPIREQNIVLGPKKKIGAKIILSRKKKHIIPQPSLIKGKHKTRKVSISLSAHKKRITRARKMSKDTKKIPTERIREQLIKKGLIKENSKAPESVLRQIYTDAIVVAQKAL